MKERTLYVVTTTKEWFLCPVGRPLKTNSTYIATSKKEFKGRYYSTTSYQVNGTWYSTTTFKEITEIKEIIK